MKKDAYFSVCRTYRYALLRIWDEAKPYALFIGLNPSTADETDDDPTIRRCLNYAQLWNYGGLFMANLFAFRATEPTDMKTANDPVGPENDKWLIKLSKNNGIIIAAWGNHGCHIERDIQVQKLIPNMKCLKVNTSGQPVHPLYQKSDIQPIPFK